MMSLSDYNIAVLAEDLYQELELWYPYYRFQEAGAEVEVLGTGEPSYTSKRGYPVNIDRDVSTADPGAYDAVIIPGGYAPDRMRAHAPLIDFVRAMDEHGKVVAFICHAGWVAVSAGILEGRRCTSVASIQDDMVNAGAEWVDEAVVRDGNLISSRVPPDLPDFCRTIIEALTEQQS